MKGSCSCSENIMFYSQHVLVVSDYLQMRTETETTEIFTELTVTGILYF